MNDAVVITLSPRARELLAAAGSITPRISENIRETMDDQNDLTIGHAQRFKLRQKGPTTLGVVSNRLRSSLARMPAKITAPGVIDSAIGSNVVYAGIHEFGFDGEVSVKGHTRRLGIFKSRRVAVMNPATGKIRKVTGRVLTKQTGTAMVWGHLRHMKMPARSFIRSSLTERAPQYGRALSSAIIRAFKPQEGSA